MTFRRVHQLFRPNSPVQKKASPFAFRSFDTLQAQRRSYKPLTQKEIENKAFQQHKFDYNFINVPVHGPEDNRSGAIATQSLPDNLKTGVENLSGLSMDDVKVHYHSDKPAQLQALAYTKGTDIHLGYGQDKHLPHELWHVVQQKQGRVKPTLQANGMSINEDARLEHEADVMGAKALSLQGYITTQRKIATEGNLLGPTIQCVLPAAVRARALAREQADPATLQGLTFCVEAIEWMLTNAGVHFRIGGSLAAHLHGAVRSPADVDIEVGTDQDQQTAAAALQQGTTWNRGQPDEIAFQPIHAQVGPMVAVVTMQGTQAATGTTRTFPVDIVNENNPLFNQSLVPPFQRGVHPGSGDLVRDAELVVNYLDRIINKPQVALQKNDVAQITSLLAAAGFDPQDQAHWANLRQDISPLVQPAVLDHYFRILEEIYGRLRPMDVD